MNEATAKVVGLGEGDEERRSTSLVPAQDAGALTPMAVLQRAVTSNASVEVIERLMGLQERWEKNQARKAFDEAMAKAKVEIPVITKNKKVDFESRRTDTRTNYSYEDFGEIVRVITPILGKHGLSVRHRTVNQADTVTVTCITSHEFGHSEENTLTAKIDLSGNKNPIQAIGSVVTYLQRYTTKAALGLAAAEDDDGRGANGSSPRRERPPSASGKPQPQTSESEELYVPVVATGEPHSIPHKGRRPEEWSEDYKATLRQAKHPQDILKWAEANAVALSQLGEAFPDLRADIDQTFNETLRESRVQTGRQKPPSAKVAEQFDSEQWRKDMEGALDGCEDAEALEGVRQTIAIEGKQATPEARVAVDVHFNKTVDRIALGK